MGGGVGVGVGNGRGGEVWREGRGERVLGVGAWAETGVFAWASWRVSCVRCGA